jgi:hypothetical protein
VTMSKHWVLGLCLAAGLAVFLQGNPSWAQEGAATGEGTEGGDQVIYKKTTIIDFSDVTITGELTKPENSYLMNKKKAQFNLLINVRDNFLPEIIKTVDNL